MNFALILLKLLAADAATLSELAVKYNIPTEVVMEALERNFQRIEKLFEGKKVC